MKRIKESLKATAILWLPILGTMIAGKLSQIITKDMIMTLIYISIPVLIISLIKMEIEDLKYTRRNKNESIYRA